MLYHFSCPSMSGNPNAGPLVFDWDDETGEVTGPAAEEILSVFMRGEVDAHPLPWGVSISSTKNRTDMAAVVGCFHRLPPELADAYPQYKGGDGAIRDLDGNILGYMDF
ncbi:hypothetical protein AGMMS50225_06830 [Betaproteobacteria bacterium]|nr:hypothetical protein AGMMS50225_06830 [Betaproteobacteria bacterium]